MNDRNLQIQEVKQTWEKKDKSKEHQVWAYHNNQRLSENQESSRKKNNILQTW